jgi:hypothetical protein
MLDDEHTYYWAWAGEDNPNSYRNPTRYRVFRTTKTTRGIPMTETMSKAEAIVECQRIVKLTGGREIK